VTEVVPTGPIPMPVPIYITNHTFGKEAVAFLSVDGNLLSHAFL
jgi:hypothetical protein